MKKYDNQLITQKFFQPLAAGWGMYPTNNRAVMGRSGKAAPIETAGKLKKSRQISKKTVSFSPCTRISKR
jgi:hypothetical protein